MRVKRSSAFGLEERRSEVASSRDKVSRFSTLLPTCSSCGASKMSSIPMGAHAAFKVRDRMGGGGDRNEHKSQPSMSFSNTDVAPQPTPPVRYNSKLMNSVWGMYNRYSVHNIKSNVAYEKS